MTPPTVDRSVVIQGEFASRRTKETARCGISRTANGLLGVRVAPTPFVFAFSSSITSDLRKKRTEKRKSEKEKGKEKKGKKKEGKMKGKK